MFAISILDKPVPLNMVTPGVQHALLAEIIINDFKEVLSISIDKWKMEDYLHQWSKALIDISNDRNATSVLVTDYLDGANLPYIAEFWALYREGDYVYVQNYYPTQNEVGSFPIRDNDYGFVRKRATGVSEWKITLADLKDWAKSLEESVKDYKVNTPESE